MQGAGYRVQGAGFRVDGALRSADTATDPIKKPERALQKLVRSYQPTLFCVTLRVKYAILASVQRYHSTEPTRKIACGERSRSGQEAVKKPERALQKLLRPYMPSDLPPGPLFLRFSAVGSVQRTAPSLPL